MRPLLVISSLAPSGPARLLTSVTPGLTSGGAVLVLGKATPWLEALPEPRAALGWRWALDLRAAREIRARVRDLRPPVIHAWDAGAAWKLLLTGACAPGRLAVSGALPPDGRVSLATRWLLQGCARVIAFGHAEAERYRRLGVRPERLAIVPLGAPAPAGNAPASPSALAPDARVVLCLGPVERHKGHREAVWAFDILRPSDARLRLVIVGSGPGLARVDRFLAGVGSGAFVHRPGAVADVGPWLARAELVWVPSLQQGGRMAALEAMAAGRPVIASDLPGLAELVLDGETGLLVPPGDKLALARAARALLEDEPRRRRMGEAARERARSRFPLSETIRTLHEVYRRAP